MNHLAVTTSGGGGLFINPFLFRRRDLNRNAAKVFESLKISDHRMAKLYLVGFIQKQLLESLPNLSTLRPASLSPPCRVDFQ